MSTRTIDAEAAHRPVDDEDHVRIDLDFDTTGEAEEFHARLRPLWESGVATPALIGQGSGRIVDEVLREELLNKQRAWARRG